jgi:hypothetical protein
VTTLVIILVLLAIAAGAVVAVPLMIRSTRRQPVEGRDPRRPAIGSPAQVWVSRGERVARELDATLSEHGMWQGVSADAELVVMELRTTAGQVAELDHALAQIADPQLAAAERIREAKQALLTKMESAVGGLEQARAEVLELIATAAAVASKPLAPDPEPVGELTSRLAGLREGLIEVRELANPEAGSGIERDGQGHP